jgi:hypothetical protein
MDYPYYIHKLAILGFYGISAVSARVVNQDSIAAARLEKDLPARSFIPGKEAAFAMEATYTTSESPASNTQTTDRSRFFRTTTMGPWFMALRFS